MTKEEIIDYLKELHKTYSCQDNVQAAVKGYLLADILKHIDENS